MLRLLPMSANTRSVDTFDPHRLRLARELHGWTKQKLADCLREADPVRAVSPAALSQYENGTSRPGPQVLAQLALILGMPRQFFEVGRPSVFAESGSAHMRSLRSTTLIERRRALVHASLAWEVVTYLEKYVSLPQVDLPHAVVDENVQIDDIENLAADTRRWFGIPDGQPIPHVVRLLESRGVVVVRLPLASRHVDAFCIQLGDRPFVLLSGDKEDKARSRFEAAHELGHLIAHHDIEPGTHVVERQANAFASAFLMPANTIRAQLPNRLDWPTYIEVKRHWGVSLASLIYRARTLGKISPDMYRRAYTELNTRTNEDGTTWRANEPGDLGAPEEPQLLSRATRLVADVQSISSMANALGLPTQMIEEIVGQPELTVSLL